MRSVAIADARRLIFIAAPAAEPDLHGPLPAFERLGGFEHQARRGEPATDLRVRKAEARVRRERAQFLVLVRRAIDDAQMTAAAPPPPPLPDHQLGFIREMKSSAARSVGPQRDRPHRVGGWRYRPTKKTT